MGVATEPFVATPLDQISSDYDAVKKTFFLHKTKPLEYRLAQLRKLYWGITDFNDAFVEALRLDLKKPAFEAARGELEWCKSDCIFVQNNLRRWAKDEKASDIPLSGMALNPRIRKDPLGTVMIISAYNFPVLLAIGPLVGAIAGGNTAILKPSEASPHTAMVLQRLFEQYLDPTAYRVVQGGIPETTALLNLKWDKIFYTGNLTVGTIIARKAAETLTPVTLELGGKNPAIVTKNADPHLVARRILWSKIMNAGQVCISQNYVMVDESVLPTLVKELEATLKTFFPNGIRSSPDFARIVNDRNYERICGMLDRSKGKILYGGGRAADEKFIELTIVQVDSVHDSLITDESFGPIIPLLPVKDLDEAIQIANDVSVTPLGIYPFGNSSETDRVLRETRSGGASINDTMFHGCQPTLAFGGVGESGTGSYRGKASFDCFVHRRSVISTPTWLESLLSLRYPPYTSEKAAKLSKMSDAKPNFDRDGNPTGTAWLWSLLGY